MSSDLGKSISQIKDQLKNNKTIIKNEINSVQQNFNLKSQSQKSRYLNQYLQYFSLSEHQYISFHQVWSNVQNKQCVYQKQSIKQDKYKIQQPQNIQQNLILKIQKEGFKISKQYASQFQINIQRESRNSKIVQVSIKFGYFIYPNLVILNNQEQSFLHQEAQIKNYGSFGNVYYADFLNQKYAIKCLEHKKSIKQNLVSCLKQYFFCLIFSALQIGPKTKKMYGFDLIVSKNCIQFTFQICDQISELDQIKNSIMSSSLLTLDQIKYQLQYSLKIMHQFKIVHRDIKPSNIMYSRSLKKAIFIDFGGCDLIKQSLGFNTETYFIGTVGYCSQEMMKILQLKYGFVDLYYNDICGLVQTIKYYKSFIEQQKNTNFYLFKDSKNQQNQYLADQQQSICYLSNFVLQKTNQRSYIIFLIKIKFDLWSKQVLSQHMWLILKQLHQNQQFQMQVLKFLQELLPSKNTKFLYNYLIKDLSKYDQTQVLYLQEYSEFIQFAYINCKKRRNISQYPQLYKILSIQYSDLQNWQKSFRIKLVDTENIKQVILSQQNNFMLIRNQQEYLYFFKLLYFISMTDDLHQASISQKAKACAIFLTLYQSSQKQQNYQNKIMYNQNQLLELLMQTLEYLFYEGIKKIPSSLAVQFYLKLFDNKLIVFGYQVNIFQLFQQIYKLRKLSLKNAILLFWKINFEMFIGSTYNVFYFSQKNIQMNTSSLIQKNQFFYTFRQFYYKFNKDSTDNFKGQLSVHNQNQQKYRAFIDTAEYFFKALIVNRQNFSKGKEYKVIQILYNADNFQILTQKQYSQLKNNIQCFVFNEIYALESESYELFHTFFNYMIRKNIINPFKRELPFFITKITTFYANEKLYKQLKLLFQFYDSIINIQKISIRFETSNRLLLAYEIKDYKMLLKITTFITNYFQSQNLNPNFYRQINSMLISCQKIQFYQNYIFKRDSKSLQLFFTLLKMLLICSKRIMDETSKIDQQSLGDLRKNRRQVASLIRLMYIFLKKNTFLKLGASNPYQDLSFRQNTMKLMKKLCKPFLNNLNIYEIYLSFLNQHYEDNRKTQLVCFEELQKLIQNNQFYQFNTQSKSKQVKATLKLFKIQAEIQFYNQTKNVYLKLIDFYKQLKNDIKLLLKFIKANKLINHLWNAHVYCQTSLNQKHVFLCQIIQILSQLQQEKTIQFYHNKLQGIFWCTCRHCYSKQTKFNPKLLIYHIYNELYVKKVTLKFDQQKKTQNLNQQLTKQNNENKIHIDNKFKYKNLQKQFPKKAKISTLIYYFCLFNEYLTFQVRTFFISQIKKNMKYLSTQIRDIIQQKIYFFIFNMIVQQLKINKDKVLEKQYIKKMERKASWILYRHYKYMRANQKPQIIAQRQLQQFVLKKINFQNKINKNQRNSQFKRKQKSKLISKNILNQFQNKMKRYRQVRQKNYFAVQDIK